MADSRQKPLKIQTDEKVFLQNGTIPLGITSSGAKYPINLPNISIDVPNFPMGPTITPLLSFDPITQNYTIGLSGDWIGKIKPKDTLQLRRGSVFSAFLAQRVIYTPGNNLTTITLGNDRGFTNLIDTFIGASGYSESSDDSFLKLGRIVESPNVIEKLVKSFSIKIVPDSETETFSLNVFWDIEPSVSATRLRWRSIPRNLNVSNLSFAIGSTGEYTEFPTANVVSNTGRSAKIELSGYLEEILVSATGSGYTTANAIAIGGGGAGASFSVSLSGTGVDSISVISGGTGYTSKPVIDIQGDGSGAVAEVSKIVVDGVNLIQQGGNYLSPPTVEIDTTNLTGPSASVISSLNLQNEGRIDYIRVIEGGQGYTGASVSISGSAYSDEAIATAEIVDGTIKNIIVSYSGHGYTGASVSIFPTGTGGTGASAVANIDIFSEWVYESVNYSEKSVIIEGFQYNVPYEIEIVASKDSRFRGLTKYGNKTDFQYYKQK